ncbi:hypothetical protein DASC09_034780 [Saccharomycopsis crataegensis]|uniref:TauD/TfdA-like domain-containing protein n=1 Tax=Saccharomycopsis crataegensis TaxID=43959 RepID=A0AAV5QMQ5_9ASCO|nr:hypothetical protein DASC09_034780 [Saccharomycopsis crataegensis]
MSLKAIPLTNAPFGATIQLPQDATDPSLLGQEDFDLLEKALHTYKVIVIPDQKNLSPRSQYVLTTRFDETCDKEGKSYGHGKTFRHKDSVLKKDGHTVPSQPQVQIIGNGHWEEDNGLKDFDLTQPSQRTFHKDTLTDEQTAAGQTRFYRWHIDSALYELSPPKCTTLLGIHVPGADEQQKIVYEDTKEEFSLTKGATAFISGAIAFNLLSKGDQELAMNTTVVYAPHPYIFIGRSKATSDGLTMVSEGKELSFDELPEWEESKVKKLPLVWTDPITGEHSLQVHGCCIFNLVRNKTGERLGLEESRQEVYRLMRPAIAPKHVYAHSWTAGDLVLFSNRQLWHSVTGEFSKDDKRLMHQCNIASGEDPVCEGHPVASDIKVRNV